MPKIWPQVTLEHLFSGVFAQTNTAGRFEPPRKSQVLNMDGSLRRPALLPHPQHDLILLHLSRNDLDSTEADLRPNSTTSLVHKL